jgi:4-alpha-glucanotransferase
MDEDLIRLADLAGIEPRYWDIHGVLHETAPDTVRVLLRALGVAADTHDDVRASLAAMSQEKWRTPLPPVVVVREPDETVVPLRLPLDCNAVRWTVLLETGGSRTGECALDALPVADVGHFGEQRVALRRLKLGMVPRGYHDLRLEAADECVTRLIVAPARCYLPRRITAKRRWGLVAQLFSLKSSSDWGIGDFGDLKMLIERIAAADADAVGLNPLHALFLDTPQQASPYSPSSRLFRNPLYLDVTAIADFAESAEARAAIQTTEIAHALHAVRDTAFVAYRTIAALKLPLLERLHANFVAHHRSDERAAAFQRYVARAGQDLRRFATFQALSERFQTHDWARWPANCQDKDSEAVRTFAQSHAERISFYEYLQWQCDEQFVSTAELARERGMAIGLYNDLAVSVDASSADHWSNRDVFAGDLRIGAPPDPFNETGQEWGVVPHNPLRLRTDAYCHFAALLRANMRDAGALRIDHVMGWQRLFLIPKGAPPSAGAYVRYPAEDLLAVAALESQRNRCIVIGEDLGTVPDGFRERMADANVLSCRVLYFEHEGDDFRRPREYPALAAVSVSTHDLATLRGFWEGEDISAKSRLGLFKSGDEEALVRAGRSSEKQKLLNALAAEGLLPHEIPASDAGHLAWSALLAQAVHLYLARAPSGLMMVQLDDLMGEAHQANLPGSTTQYPNWRRRLSHALDDVLADDAMWRATAAIAAERAK